MRSRGKQLSWWNHVALVIAILAPAIIYATEDGKALLRRKRIASELTTSNGAVGAKQTSHADAWEQEAAQAEIDAERILQNFVFMSITGPPLACLQGRTKEQYFFELFSQITDPLLLRDNTTPQGKAFDYMVNRDPVFNPDPCSYPTPEQRYGLLTLYYSTIGPTWTNSTGWLTGSSECTWFGVTCGAQGSGRRLQGSSDRVFKLELPFNNLQGTIPNEISTLIELENLDIFANSITSTLPTGFGHLTRLLFLDAERNLLTGQIIPDTYLKLSKLQALRLSRNEFTGSLPAAIGLWSDLQQFWLSNNKVVGSIPTQIGNLRKLKTTFLYENDIDGHLPSQMGLLTDLSIIRLDGNILEGRVPEEFYSLTNLVDLRLDGNFLSGSISTAIGKLTSLADLRLNQNLFTGTIPTQIALLTNLKDLLVYQNYLNESLPDAFAGYTQLEQLDVSTNFLTGTIPTSIFTVPSIKFVYLSNNSFIGPLPSNFQNPSLLHDLYLDGNFLTGTIPPVQTGHLLQLNEFLINYNLFSGTMPQSFCDLRFDAILDDLFADCGGANPEIQCDFPDCCNRCFSGERPPRRQIR